MLIGLVPELISLRSYDLFTYIFNHLEVTGGNNKLSLTRTK